MIDQKRGMKRRAFVAGAAAWGAAALLRPARAWADPTASEKWAEAGEVRAQVVALQEELTIAGENYYKALDEHEVAAQAVAAAQERIDEANAQIAVVQEKLGRRARGIYRGGQTSVIDLILGATTFDELALNWELLNTISEDDTAMIQETKDLRAQIEADKAVLDKQERIANERKDEAARLKAQAEETLASLEATLEQLDAEAQELLMKEQEAARAANAAAAAANVRRTYAYSSVSSGLAVPSQAGVVDYALSRIGCPYVWGAAGPEVFDCSGLVRWAYLQIGISVPHQTESMYYAAAARLPLSAAEPGDVLWISYGDGYNGHVGIACNTGGTHFVHAPTFNTSVRDTDPLSWAGFTHVLRFV